MSLWQRFDIVSFSKTLSSPTILLSCITSCYFTCIVGEWVDVLCVAQGDDRWPRAKGLKWWWGRVGGRETSTLQPVVQISYSSGQMLRSLVIHQVDWPRFQCLHKSVDGQFQMGRKRKQAVVSMAGRLTHFSFAAAVEQVNSSAVPSTGQYCVSNSPSMLNLYGSPKQKKAEIIQPFFHRAAALQQKHGDLWDQSNPDRWLERLSIDLNSRYSLWLLSVCILLTPSKCSQLKPRVWTRW